MGEVVPFPLIFQVESWVRERCPSPLATHHLQESWPSPSPAAVLRRAGLLPHLSRREELNLSAGVHGASHETMTLRVLAPTPICYMAEWERKRCPLSPPLTTCGMWESWPGVMRMGDLVKPLTSCSARESRLCTSPGQPSRVGTGGVGVVSQSCGCESRTGSIPCSLLPRVKCFKLYFFQGQRKDYLK